MVNIIGEYLLREVFDGNYLLGRNIETTLEVLIRTMKKVLQKLPYM